MKRTQYLSLLKKCPYSELFWFIFSRIQSKCWKTQILFTQCIELAYHSDPNVFHFKTFFDKFPLNFPSFASFKKENSNQIRKNLAKQKMFLLLCLFLFFSPEDTGRKLSIHKTCRRRPRHLLNVLCTFNLRPVSTGSFQVFHQLKGGSSVTRD